jgi:hypothetical protein
VDREGSLYADVVRNLTNRERSVNAVLLAALENETLENLDTLLGSLDDLRVNANYIAWFEVRDVRLSE